MNDDQKHALQIHNTARAGKHLHPLVWDNGLHNEAKAYAQHLAHIGKLEHSGKAGEGENLFFSSPTSNALQHAAQAWINEAKNYHHETIPTGNFASYGHYTQCMWRSTTKVGIGAATAPNGNVYVVGRYTPQGNIVGQKPF